MEILAKLFGSQSLVKIMRLFLFNPEEPYDNRDIAKRAKVHSSSVRWGVGLLSKIGFLKRRVFFKEIERGRGKRRRICKKKTVGWTLDQKFPYVAPLHTLLVSSDLLSEKEIERKLRRVGRLKLVLVSGVFIQDWDSRVDLLIVGDNIKRPALEAAIKAIEADIGTELRYTFFETKQFEYRLSIYDRLVRDILDYPHHKIINKLEI